VVALPQDSLAKCACVGAALIQQACRRMHNLLEEALVVCQFMRPRLLQKAVQVACHLGPDLPILVATAQDQRPSHLFANHNPMSVNPTNGQFFL